MMITRNLNQSYRPAYHCTLDNHVTLTFWPPGLCMPISYVYLVWCW